MLFGKIGNDLIEAGVSLTAIEKLDEMFAK
jgi:hypothetical protein